MSLGLKRGEIYLTDHDPEWEAIAADTIKQLWGILGDIAVDIQHVGSTSITSIKAKPVIDIAVSVKNFDDVLALSPVLEKDGFFFRGWEGGTDENKRQPVFQCGEYVSGEKDMLFLTHYIHIVKECNPQWDNYINFRDYMNTFPKAAREYEALKLCLTNMNNGNLHDYLKGKLDYIVKMCNTAHLWKKQKLRTDTINYLNKIYKPITDKSAEIKTGFNNAGFKVTEGFYNNHYVREKFETF